jgi:hypothetical protein
LVRSLGGPGIAAESEIVVGTCLFAPIFVSTRFDQVATRSNDTWATHRGCNLIIDEIQMFEGVMVDSLDQGINAKLSLRGSLDEPIRTGDVLLAPTTETWIDGGSTAFFGTTRLANSQSARVSQFAGIGCGAKVSGVDDQGSLESVVETGKPPLSQDGEVIVGTKDSLSDLAHVNEVRLGCVCQILISKIDCKPKFSRQRVEMVVAPVVEVCVKHFLPQKLSLRQSIHLFELTRYG